MEIILVVLLASFLGGVIQGISGFAFAIVFLGVTQFSLPYVDRLALMSLLSMVLLPINCLIYRKHIDWRLLPLPLAANVVCNWAALRFLRYTAAFPYWDKLLGVAFIVLAIYMYLWQNKIHLRPSVGNAILFCGAAGVLQALFGMGGPLAVLYFLAVTGDDTKKYLGTLQMFFLLNNCLGDFAGRLANGMITTATLHYGLWGAVALIAGLWGGNTLFRRLNAATLKKVVYGVMFADGWYMLLLG